MATAIATNGTVLVVGGGIGGTALRMPVIYYSQLIPAPALEAIAAAPARAP